MDKLSSPHPTRSEAGMDARVARDVSSDWISQFQICLKGPAGARFATQSRIVETYGTMRLRAFGKHRPGAAPTLIVTPVAVHDAGFVDLIRGHSLVQTLAAVSEASVFVTDWISATPDMASLSIDSYLAELNIAIDDLGGDVNVVGLGAGGCLALIHAARFPGKIKRLVLAGAPVDVSVRPSLMTRFASRTVECGELPADEVVSGAQRLSPLGAAQGHERAAIETLQRNPASFSRADLNAITAYEDWAARSLDVPGRYAREMLAEIFAGNRLATGDLVALGRRIRLKDVRIPLFVLAGARDEITPKMQALSVLQLVGTAKARMRSLVAPCSHFSLFVGAGALSREWRMIAGWLGSSAPFAAGRERGVKPSTGALPASDRSPRAARSRAAASGTPRHAP